MGCYLVTALWGDWHTRVFTEMNLRTLLAERNLPLFAREVRCTYLVYTRATDAGWIASSAAWQALARIMPVHIEVLPDSAFTNPIDTHVAIWHAGADRARNDGAYMLTIPADFAWADGAFATIAGHLAAGKRAIYYMCIRVVHETFAEDFAAAARPGELAVRFTPRQLMALTMRHLHPLHAAYTRDCAHFAHHMEYSIWPVEGEGFIMRLLVGSVLCYDPRRFDLDPKFSLAQAESVEDVAVIDDSDDMYSVSLTPLLKDRNWYFTRRRTDPDEVGGWWLQYDGAFQWPLAQRWLRFHTGDMTPDAWRRVGRQSDFFVVQALLAREMIRIGRVMAGIGLHKAADCLAVALYGNRLRRRWTWRGPVTVFCPVDDAFAVLGGLESLLAEEGQDALFALVKAHVALGPVELPVLPDEGGAFAGHGTVTSLADDVLPVTVEGGTTRVGGCRVLDRLHLPHGNTLYVIDGLLGRAAAPPTAAQ
ncbi:fasciclin domain-containing protein [Azospirillum rugosum]|uniref:FAS1 domain-containing protein n=1 Tax=Azospirillum rugosum TaxID=416170 RepID=A0ABS4SQ06_9PROT|nr:fasciclin domain-containing protein [Azospirillum rugosum]MBP2294319.1 hypothetical protein [Azospirillum rugosum]